MIFLGKYFGKPINLLNKKKEKRLKKISVLESEVKAIDEEIKRQKDTK